MSARVVGLGCVTPEHFAEQSQAAEFGIDGAGLGVERARFARIIYARSGVARRASTLLRSTSPSGQPLDQDFIPARAGEPGDSNATSNAQTPTTGDRMARYSVDAKALAVRAASAALQDAANAGIGPADITHIVSVSCTGFCAPGIDHELIDRLGLRRTIRRLHIGYMGCHGAINALGAARAFVNDEGDSARILVVCVELCSLHFQRSERPDQIVANALFADGAAACVVSGDSAARGPSVSALGGCVFPNSGEAMGWRIADTGFEMTLGESVPRLIEANLAPWLAGWLDSRGRSLEELVKRGRWAIHPGGPRILDAVQRSLSLSDDALRPSRQVLRDFGNMSSPTVLFILQRLLSDTKNAPADAGSLPVEPVAGAESLPTVILAFGPGLSVEAALLD